MDASPDGEYGADDGARRMIEEQTVKEAIIYAEHANCKLQVFIPFGQLLLSNSNSFDLLPRISMLNWSPIGDFWSPISGQVSGHVF